jgi:prepilin signal peptidase PulO-like enzyme (type II secretory pathway)
MVWFFLFIFGLAIGSFVNVVATRYDGEHFLFANKVIGGRSHCDGCKKTLQWFELIPLFSFVMQGGRCRTCKAKLSVQYPLVELASGLIFLFVPLALAPSIAAIFWIIVFESLLLMTLIDIELGIIPDEICIFLTVLGIVLAINNDPVSRLIAALVAGAFFGLLILITKGKGMGMGDLKLAIPLGLLFGWPTIALVLMFAFLTGAVAGLIAIAFQKNTMKGTIAFGPFLAIGAAIVFFWGPSLVTWYLSILQIQ